MADITKLTEQKAIQLRATGSWSIIFLYDSFMTRSEALVDYCHVFK